MKQLNDVLMQIYGTPWAIMPEKLTAILKFIDCKVNGITFTKEELEGRFGALSRPAATRQGAVAIIPVFGVIGQRTDFIFDFFSGGTSTEKLTKQIRAAVDDPNIKAIVLDIDSPGGTVGGVTELSKVIFEARQKKHIVAVSNSLMASAAFWIGSSADEIVVTPSGEVGSIGVFTVHEDISQMAENVGVKVTLISAGKFKTEGNQFEPLANEARDSIQSDVDGFFEMFVNDVARNRGVSTSAVKNGFGEGRLLNAKKAKAAGMVDRIATLDETLARLGAGPISGRKAEATNTTVKITTEDGWTKSLNFEDEKLIIDEPLTRDEATADAKEIDIDLKRKQLELLNF